MTRPAFYSHTQLSLYQDCPRKYHYAYSHNLKRMDKVGLPALWSRALLHPAIAHAYSFQSLPPQEWWDTHNTNYVYEGGHVASLDPIYNVLTAKKALLAYQPFLEEDLKEYKVLQTETQIDWHPTPPITFRSVADALLQQKETGERWTLEVKSSKYAPRSEPMGQSVGYCIATNAVGVIQVHFQLKTLPKGGCKIEITRLPLHIPQDARDEWLNETATLISHIAFNEETDVWPKNPQACHRFNQPCPYLDACRGVSLAPHIIQRWKEES